MAKRTSHLRRTMAAGWLLPVLALAGCPADFQEQMNQRFGLPDTTQPQHNRGFDTAGETTDAAGTFGRGEEPVRQAAEGTGVAAPAGN